MSKGKQLLIAFDDVVNALTNEYGGVMDTHIYSPREILHSIGSLHPVDAVEEAEYDAIVYKLECLLCHATGGKYSKSGYSLEDMERMVTDYIEECCQEAVEDEVVRCKDCKYYDNGDCTMLSEPEFLRKTERWVVYVDENDFCSCGERRANENSRDIAV